MERRPQITMPMKPSSKFYLALWVMAALALSVFFWIGPGGAGPWRDNAARRADTPWKQSEGGLRHPNDTDQQVALVAKPGPDAPARADESLLRFADEAGYRAFLDNAARHGVRVLGSIDALRVVRIAIVDADAWRATPAKEKGEESPNYLVYVPDLPDGGIQPDAVGFGGDVLGWLGITTDNKDWGNGVTVAILDTGVAAHPGITSTLNAISLLADPLDPTANGHGTGVASLIAGSSGQTPGIAPAVDLLSVQIVDASGSSDTFLVAQGIIAAVDRGADVINISLGSSGDSKVLRDAVAYAQQRGAVIVASAGNNGVEMVSYPAAYDGVIAVGAVDARGEKLDFSNTGWAIDAMAPGYNLNVAWPGDKIAGFTGTSASAPILTGAIAATMSQSGISAADAAKVVLNHANEAGAIGQDTSYGVGIVDVGRVMARNTPGIHDAAVATQAVSVNNAGGTVEVIVQNRGTETLADANLTVIAGGQKVTVNTGKLTAGAVTSQKVRVGEPKILRQAGSTIQSTIALPGGVIDSNPANNTRTATVAK